MTKRILFSICAVIAFSFSVSAQKSATNFAKPAIRVATGKTTVQPGEQVILKLNSNSINEEMTAPQWQVSTDGVNWYDVPRANGNNFETAPLTQSQFFRVVTRPNDGYLALEETSNVQNITVGDNVASSKKKKQ